MHDENPQYLLNLERLRGKGSPDKGSSGGGFRGIKGWRGGEKGGTITKHGCGGGGGGKSQLPGNHCICTYTCGVVTSPPAGAAEAPGSLLPRPPGGGQDHDAQTARQGPVQQQALHRHALPWLPMPGLQGTQCLQSLCCVWLLRAWITCSFRTTGGECNVADTATSGAQSGKMYGVLKREN